MIKAIFFDIGGVVTFINFQGLYANFANRAGIPPEVVSQYHSDHWSDMLLGNINLDQFFQDMKVAGGDQGLNLPVAWLEEAMKLRTLNTELLDVIDRLRGHYMMNVLSNLTATRLMVDEATHLYDHFDIALLSCKEHLKKPDPKFYRLALQRANVDATEAVFIDDKESNVMAARELGFKDILYTDNEKLLTELGRLGVTID